MSQRTEFDARRVYVFVMTPFTTRHNQRGQYELDLAGIEQNITHFPKVPGEKTMVIYGGLARSRPLHHTKPFNLLPPQFRA